MIINTQLEKKRLTPALRKKSSRAHNVHVMSHYPTNSTVSRASLVTSAAFDYCPWIVRIKHTLNVGHVLLSFCALFFSRNLILSRVSMPALLLYFYFTAHMEYMVQTSAKTAHSNKAKMNDTSKRKVVKYCQITRLHLAIPSYITEQKKLL